MKLQAAFRALRKPSVRRGLDLARTPLPHSAALAAVERAERLPAGSLGSALSELRILQAERAERSLTEEEYYGPACAHVWDSDDWCMLCGADGRS